MALPLLDRSNYYKGLLILVRRDRTIDSRERELMIEIGRLLDFDVRFCEAAIDDVLGNRHIKDRPIIFPDRKVAECFLLDGLRLALAGKEMHPQELAWLRSVARSNHLNPSWLDKEAGRIQRNSDRIEGLRPFAIQQLL